MQLITSLKQYGLLENEAKVYLTLLKLIEAPAYQIACEAAIPRSTVYHILEGLKTKGLILELKKRKEYCILKNENQRNQSQVNNHQVKLA